MGCGYRATSWNDPVYARKISGKIDFSSNTDSYRSPEKMGIRFRIDLS